jgi:hypothetical protein
LIHASVEVANFGLSQDDILRMIFEYFFSGNTVFLIQIPNLMLCLAGHQFEQVTIRDGRAINLTGSAS